MTESFLIFQSFNDAELAQALADRLQKEGILFQVEDTSSPIDPVIIGSGLDSDIRIKLKQKDFQKAHEILEEQYSNQLDSIEKDYYLFDFTDQELIEILEKPDEWGYLDFKLAQKILKDRGVGMEVEKIELLKTERIKEIAKPEEIGRSWIFLGYFLSIFFSPIGIFYGSTITTFKKTLPNGERVYVYGLNDRKHGRNILLISTCVTILWILFRLLAVV
jgi:hypothetical protein